VSEYKIDRIGGKALRPESLMMSYGYDPQLSEGAIKCPIFQTSTFVFESAEAGKAYFEVALGLREKGPTEELGLIYSRLNNPDLEVLEDRLSLWDGAEACAVFESGMAAIATALLTFVRPGDVLLHSEPLYGGTDYLINHFLRELGVLPVGFAAGTSVRDVEESIGERIAGRRLSAVLIETPANPTNQLVDIEGVGRLARSLGDADDPPVVMVDNTFLGPLWQHPLRHGADLVLYSATKFIGGHSDVIAGACLGRAEPMAAVRTLRTFMGTTAGPWSGWLLLRSLETLKMRMTAQMKNARYVADFLADHPRVLCVNYLGLLDEEHPMHTLYRAQCLSPGSLMSFDVEGGEAGAFRFLNALRLAKLAVSLGSTETLVEHPASMTHADVAPEQRERMGIAPSMVRLSVGVEHFEDIVADLEQALAAV
jgi:methionine-gamma-lyase